MTITTREDWLEALAAALRPVFIERGHALPDKIKFSVSWMHTGHKSKAIGQCYPSGLSSDGETVQILITPCLADALEVAGVLVHELCHAQLGAGKGHGPDFKAVATALGLEGNMKHALPGKATNAILVGFIDAIGPYPHTALSAGSENSGQGKPFGDRLLNVRCPCCGFFAKQFESSILDGFSLTCPVDGSTLATKEQRR